VLLSGWLLFRTVLRAPAGAFSRARFLPRQAGIAVRPTRRSPGKTARSLIAPGFGVAATGGLPMLTEALRSGSVRAACACSL
jgi:hypothetical protein